MGFLSDICIIVFSHSDNPEKKQLLEKSILQLKKLELPIILSSHISVEKEVQESIDYFLYDKNNPIFKETDFFDLDLPVTESSFNSQGFFSNISTRSYVRKETYWPSVINHFIRSVNYADFLGFKYCFITEYDYLYEDIHLDKIQEIMNELMANELDGFFVPCYMNDIPTVYPVPIILPVKKFIEYSGKDLIKNSEDYVRISSFKICEQWVRDFFDLQPNPMKMKFDDYVDFFGSSHKELKLAGEYVPIYGNINSGIFIDKNDEKNWIVSVFNGTEKTINVSLEVESEGEILMDISKSYEPSYWFYQRIPREITEGVLENNKNLNVFEKISVDSIVRTYGYQVSKENYKKIKKCKWYIEN